jgi:hypothetical protein
MTDDGAPCTPITSFVDVAPLDMVLLDIDDTVLRKIPVAIGKCYVAPIQPSSLRSLLQSAKHVYFVTSRPESPARFTLAELRAVGLLATPAHILFVGRDDKGSKLLQFLTERGLANVPGVFIDDQARHAASVKRALPHMETYHFQHGVSDDAWFDAGDDTLRHMPTCLPSPILVDHIGKLGHDAVAATDELMTIQSRCIASIVTASEAKSLHRCAVIP